MSRKRKVKKTYEPSRCPECGAQYRNPTGPACGECFLARGVDVELVPLTRAVHAPLAEDLSTPGSTFAPPNFPKSSRKGAA